MYLIVYIDDVIIIDSDQSGIIQDKQHIRHHFQTKDLDASIFFMYEVEQSKDGIVISHKKNYALYIIEETGLTSSKSVDTHGSKYQTSIKLERVTFRSWKMQEINWKIELSHCYSSRYFFCINCR